MRLSFSTCVSCVLFSTVAFTTGCGGGGSTTTNGVAGKCIYAVTDTLGVLPSSVCAGTCIAGAGGVSAAVNCKQFGLAGSTASVTATWVFLGAKTTYFAPITPTASCTTSMCTAYNTANSIVFNPPHITMP